MSKDTKYGCAVVKMHKTKSIKKALKERGLSDAQIMKAKVIRFSNRLYTAEELEVFKNQKDLPNEDKSYDELFEEKGISKYNMKSFAYLYTESLICDNKIDAMLSREAEIHRLQGKQNGLVTLQSLERVHCVYAFKLSPEVLEEKKFLDDNPGLDTPEHLVYIGMTSKNREERFEQHINAPLDDSRDLGAKFMRKYGIKNVKEADLTTTLLNHKNFPNEHLTKGEALNTERYYGQMLKSEKVGTWWN